MCINMFLRLVKCGSWTPLGAARLYVGQYEREDAAKALRVRALWNCCCRGQQNAGGVGGERPLPHRRNNLNMPGSPLPVDGSRVQAVG